MAIMLRYFNGAVGYKDIVRMSLRQFKALYGDINEVLKLENPETTPMVLEGDMAVKFAEAKYGKKTRKSSS